MNDKRTEKEKMVYVSLYKKDTFSYALALLATAMEFLYVVVILDSIPISFWMGITVMINIFLLFVLFTCAVKMNIYEMKWAIRGVLIGAYMLLRQFVLVPMILCPTKNTGITSFANFAGAGLLITAGILNLSKAERRAKQQKKISESSKVKE